MKKTLFLMSHPGSDWQNLVKELNLDPRIEISMSGFEHHHIFDVDYLTKQPHKSNNSLSIWGDVILHNHQFTCQSLFKHSYFIFLDSGFKECHNDWKSYSDAENYYKIRLYGMRSYYRRAQKALWNPAFEDINKFFN